MQRSVITILGGGFSGSALAVHLAHLPGQYTADVHLVEPRSALGPGLAYSGERPEYLLNVRACSLSLLAQEPGHFTAWLSQNGVQKAAQQFFPRQLYGQYVQETVAPLLTGPAANGLRFFRHATSATAVRPLANEQAAQVELADGQRILSNHVVLALGNFPPLPPTQMPEQPPGFHPNPWAPGALATIAPTDSVLLIGSGLTAVDVLLGLRATGHQGPLTVVSGHGHWPAAHLGPQAPYPSFYHHSLQNLTTVSQVLTAVRQEIRQAARAGIDWRPVLDSLRPDLGRIWAAWPPEEQSRFLRHLASLWTTVRHRSPPQNAAFIAGMLSSGQLRQHVGRVQHLEPAAEGLRVHTRHAGQLTTLFARHVIACTGPLLDYTRIPDPLIVQMRTEGLLLPDALRLGILTNEHGALLQRHGAASPMLFTLGASRRPQSFESTAVPELRQQAADLALHLAALLPAA
ncbi:NAD(P)-binding protein [Hymenobacter sp. BT18]|uniref:FAD/NAD(P)-binding protein n=1 Tax=Hymenobacter sp. BT18 TaxID=2835648 RepID=UPI00143E79ED|nr:FAD/NAD(P)-binding protein [Hymenobacter sp. BT18]QIX60245.1 NAD(P)-binding protein [Hymenobacter sp. BT18]